MSWSMLTEIGIVGTQEDQNEYDEKTRKKAMNGLVQSWMDRLQLISVIVRRLPTPDARN